MKLLVVDDHPLLREGLAALLRQARPEIQVILAGSGADGLDRAAAEAGIEAILLDIVLPGEDGLAVLRDFGRRFPSLPVLVLSASEDPDLVQRSLEAGALGYIPKSASRQTFLTALQLVLDGEIYVPPLLLASLGDPGRYRDGASGAILRLSARQKEVLRLVADGRSNKEIGNLLGLAEKTVKSHVTAILRTLDVGNRTQAASLLRRLEP